MDHEMQALLAGVVAGLALALPLGAISILILQQALTRGWRVAAAAATGVALVDLSYAAVATTAGTAVTRVLAGHTRLVQLTGAVVLAAVALRGLVTLRTSALVTSTVTTPAAPTASPAGPSTPAAPTASPAGPSTPAAPTASLAGPSTPAGPAASPGTVLRRFVALTAINPLTAVYFVVLAAGLGPRVAGAGAATAFVVGVFVGSLAWQLVLAGVGSFAGARLPAWARTATGLVGYVTILGYAAKLAAG